MPPLKTILPSPGPSYVWCPKCCGLNLFGDISNRKFLVPGPLCVADQWSINDSSLSAFSISSFSFSNIVVEEGLLDGDYLGISCTLRINNKNIHPYALIVTGASGFALVDETFATHHHLHFAPLKSSWNLVVIDGRSISLNQITHLTHLGLNIDSHKEDTSFFVTTLGHLLVLRIPWMKLHDVAIYFASNSITFGSQFCTTHCTSYNIRSKTQGISSPLPQRRKLDICMIGNASFNCLTKSKDVQLFSVSLKAINEA